MTLYDVKQILLTKGLGFFANTVEYSPEEDWTEQLEESYGQTEDSRKGKGSPTESGQSSPT